MKALAARAILLIVLMLVAALPTYAGDAKKEAVHLRNIRQLTFAGSRSGEGYFSPDGRQILFQSTRAPADPHEAENPFYQIFRMDLRGGGLTRLSTGVGKTTCSFFRPDGKRVLFASTHLDPDALKKQREEIEFQKSGKQRRYQWDFDDAYDIFDVRPDGTGLRRLTNAKGYDAEGSYSPDGKHICFTSNRDGDLEIYVMDADGGNQRRVTHDPGYDGGPFFSPDGQWIVYRHFTSDGRKAEVMMIRPDGSGKRQITHLDAMSWAPYFHPGGKWIVFCSNKDGGPGNFQLYVIRPDGTGLTRLTYRDGFDGLPVFSPAGKKLMWTSTRTGGKSQLFIADFIAPRAEATASAANDSSAESIRSPFDPERIEKSIEYLASPALEGRRTATPGERMAATFIEKQLRDDGLHTVKEQPFDFRSGVGLGPNNALEITLGPEKIRAGIDKDFAPLSLSANGEVEGDVVFVGYGIVAENYDSFAGLDVKNKIVLAMRFQPEAAPEKEKDRLRHFAPLRMKAMTAREHGAKALLVFAGPNSLPEDVFVSGSDGSIADSGILAAQISRKLAEKILGAAGKDLKTTQDSFDKLETRSGFVLPGVTVKARVDLKKKTATGRNIFAVVRAGARDRIDEAIVIGAHYDHLGHGDENSLAPKPGEIHPGADDNASGTAGVIELARYFNQRRSTLRRDLIFTCFSGEELGILGSAAFVRNPPVKLSSIVAMVNMDMIGRLREQRLMVQGTGSSALWPRLVEQYAVSTPLHVTLTEDPYLPTDSTSFYQKGIPTLSFFTGSHSDYHRPSDTADKINAGGEAEVLDLVRRIVEDLATRREPPLWAKVTERATEGPREGLRAYLGTIPDYSESNRRGVKLSGVRPGSPAEKAGLRAGDVIVKLGAKQIANIYDYTYALEGVKIGAPLEIVAMRDEKPVTLTIVPEQRK